MSDNVSSSMAMAVEPGSVVRVRDTEGEQELTVVLKLTAEMPPGCVSVASPVGRALLGRRRGEQVQAHTPSGVRVLMITYVAAPAPLPPRSARPCGG